MKYIKKFEELDDKSLILILDLSNRYLNEIADLSKYVNLKILNCQYNQLTSLPELPDTLIELNCYKNKLTSLPELPKKLKVLDCERNELLFLPELPDTLIELYCFRNNLTSLPELPKTLSILNCRNNILTSLPELPKTLKELQCVNNKLPFINLEEYNNWYKENKQLIDTEGLEYTYQLYQNINKYNL